MTARHFADAIFPAVDLRALSMASLAVTSFYVWIVHPEIVRRWSHKLRDLVREFWKLRRWQFHEMDRD